MSKRQDVSKALGLLREQIEDDQLDPKDRRDAAKAVLAYHKENVRKYQGVGAKDERKNSAVKAAERLRRVK